MCVIRSFRYAEYNTVLLDGYHSGHLYAPSISLEAILCLDMIYSASVDRSDSDGQVPAPHDLNVNKWSYD